jgi:hypothetical protein
VADWRLALLADTAARVDSLATVLAADALAHPDDDQLAGWCALADRAARDLERLILDLGDDGPILCRSRGWVDAA